MENNLCVICKKRSVLIKKRQLCMLCYQRERKKVGSFYDKELAESYGSKAKVKHVREMKFIKNYFNYPNNWVYQPANFHLNGSSYAPDFYDSERNVFIEVSGTRQAYHINKEKYKLFRETFPKIVLEIRKTSGELVNEESQIDWT